MPVQQVAFYVPPEIQEKIALGILKQWGGVVRDNKGHIVKHLEPVPFKPDDTADVAQKAIALAKSNKNVVIGVGAVAVAAVAAISGLAIKKIVDGRNAKAAESAAAALAAEFGEALQEYMEAVQQGSMDEGRIDRLLFAIDALGSGEDAKVTVSLKQMKSLCSTIYDYSVALEKANKVKVVDFKRPKPKSSADAFDDVRECLLRQKQIFQMVA